MKSDYEYFLIDNVICIRDLNLGGMSVTNNAESIIHEIVKAEPILREWKPVKVVYQDSSKIWDEILIDENFNFKGFASIGAMTPFVAVHRLKLKYAGIE